MADGTREEEEPVAHHGVLELILGIEAAHGGAVLVFDVGGGDKYGGPALLPGRTIRKKPGT